MKKLFFALALIGVVSFFAQSAFAACPCQGNWYKPSNLYYLNPMPYMGIGENRTSFSLNPFKGFKNCNKCEVPKCDSCCTGAAAPVCPTCVKAFPDQNCNECDEMIMEEIYIIED